MSNTFIGRAIPPGNSATRSPSPGTLGHRRPDRQSTHPHRIRDQSGLCQPREPNHFGLGRGRHVDRRPLEAVRGTLADSTGASPPAITSPAAPATATPTASAGITYTRGPIELPLRLFLRDLRQSLRPAGHVAPGITAKITSNVTLWCEYTYWDSQAGSPLKAGAGKRLPTGAGLAFLTGSAKARPGSRPATRNNNRHGPAGTVLDASPFFGDAQARTRDQERTPMTEFCHYVRLSRLPLFGGRTLDKLI